jgi:hypothetical protein
VALMWLVLGEAVIARCEAHPSTVFPLPPILKGLRVFFGVRTDWVSCEGGADSLLDRISVSSSTSVFSGNGGGDLVVLLSLPPIRKLPTLAF